MSSGCAYHDATNDEAAHSSRAEENFFQLGVVI